MSGRSYGQYCALAKALDHVGDRWTLLIIRELLIGPRRYTRIRTALPGIATNLLADRLDALVSDGLAVRSDDREYELTPAGRELEPAVLALVRWGSRWMGIRDAAEVLRPEWLVVALRALLPEWRPGSVEVRIDGKILHVDQSTIDLGAAAKPDAVIEGSAEEVLAVVAGKLPLSTLKIRGDRKVAAAGLGRA